MSTVQGNLIDHSGNKVAPNTLDAAVYDAAKEQALSATLAETPDKRALGYPTFSTVTAYAEGDVVFYSNTLWRFTQSHAAGAWNADHVEAYSVKQLAADVKEALEGEVDDLKDDLEDGTIVPPLAGNLEPWADQDDLTVQDTFTDTIRTTAGSNPIVTEKGGVLMRIVPKTDFSCAKLITTGYNQLRLASAGGAAVALSTGFYFPVPKLTFGEYGSARENNGVLFTNSEGENLNPTVYFKPLASGVPTSLTDGTQLTAQTVLATANQNGGIYTDHGLKFYLTPGPGYLIVSGITHGSTCAHIAWEDWYDKYVAVDDEHDAGGSVNLSGIFSAVHSGLNKLLVVKVGSRTVFDEAYWSGTTLNWIRRVDRVASPSWTNTLNDDGETYTHSLTISGMRAGGIAQIEGQTQELSVDGTTVSYVDSSATALSGAVKYELAAEVTGTLTMSPSYALNDCGIEMLTSAVGEAFVTSSYARNIADALAEIAAHNLNDLTTVFCETIAALEERIRALEISKDKLGNAKADTVDANEITVAMYPLVLWATGVPAANLVPDNLPAGLPWDGAPAFIGQIYIDLTANAVKVYIAKGFGAVSDWVVLN